ncbi:YjeF protein, partial [Aeromonas molluscorum 848]
MPLYELMERAGAALLDYARQHWPDAHHWWVFTGPGNKWWRWLRVGQVGPGCRFQSQIDSRA